MPVDSDHVAMPSLGVIPARFGSSRFPGKPLVSLDGLPMVVRTARQAMASNLDSVVVATDDRRIVRACEDHGVDVLLTRGDHASGTDRVAEVARTRSERWIINIQGDEPLIDPQVINQVLQCMKTLSTPGIVTACTALETKAERENPNVVKALLHRDGQAQSFVRHLDGNRDGELTAYKHLGIYGYPRETLFAFTALEPSPTERRLRLEQWRALENNLAVVAVVTNYKGHGVDCPEDLPFVLECLRNGG